MPPSPLADADGPLRVTVTCNGQALADSVVLLSVRVQRCVAGIPLAQLVVADGDMASGTWPVADGDPFVPGVVVRIAAGHGTPGQTLFEGTVARVGVHIGGDNTSRLELECRSRAESMTRGRRHAHHAGQSDSEIIAGLITRHGGLGATVDTTLAQHAGLTQFDCSDWDFIVSRARANGLVVIADDDRVRVQAPALDSQPVLSVRWGQDLLDFRAELDGDPPGPRDRTGLARTRGRMRFPGSALAGPGTLIEVGGVGARFSGKVWVRAVEHEMADDQWVTTVDFGPLPPGQAAAAGAAGSPALGRLPEAGGLQVGVVAASGTDPQDEQRIQVRLPQLGADAPPAWARLAQFLASRRFGARFMPEPGDEVVVGFFDHDPSQPVVLGSLYSSQRPPADAASASADLKSLVTRSGHRLEFDDAQRLVRVATPAGNEVLLDDGGHCLRLRDEQGNQVLLHRGGIQLDSCGDLTIAARGTITLNAIGAVNIGTPGNLGLAGLNVVCEAQLGFSGKGGMTAELSASGQTSVKGSLVVIN